MDFRFNPHRCEDHLSVFGKKVLNVLIHKWKCDQNRTQNVHRQRFNSLQNKRAALKYEETFISSPPTIFHEINSEGGSNVDQTIDENFRERNLPCVPTNLQLFQTVKTNNKATDNIIDINVSSHDLVSPVLSGYISLRADLVPKTDGGGVTNPSLPLNSNCESEKKQSKDIDWDDMFDSEIFSEVATEKAEFIFKPIETPFHQPFDIKFPRDMSITTRNSFNIKQNKSLTYYTKKHKQEPITDIIPKKVKQVSYMTKASFRKQPYTKTVNNWLNDVDPSIPVEKDETSSTNVVQNSACKQAKIIIEKNKEKSCKKVVQAQLANKDGVMKFKKPKTLNNEKQKDVTISDETVNTKHENATEITTTTETLIKNGLKKSKAPKDNKIEKECPKEKKNKPKFVAPIKSLIPVKDVLFKVITVNENNTQQYLETWNSIMNQDLVIVLIYSNGFSQLNKHHTEDACEPEGIIIVNNDDYFYFKKYYDKNKENIQALLENNRIICYEGKCLLIYLKYIFNADIYNIDMIDTKIGGSLLEPDCPPESFSELQKVLSFTPEFTIATECALQKTAWYASLLKECGSRLMSLLMEEQLWNVFVEIEMKLLPIIAEMEIRGVTVDSEKLKSMEDILLEKMKSTELECHKAAGKSFQINSTVQVRALIYDELQLDTKCNVKIRETLTIGAKSTSESMLRSLVSKHPLPKLILEYRHLHKAHATFLTGIAQQVKDGIVRPTWVQTAAATGRIASNNPNLQAIPKAPFNLVMFPDDNDTDKQMLSIRSVYVAREGYTLLAADFKHVECRVFAHAAADRPLLAALRDTADLFRVLAHKWMKKPLSAVSAQDRERTKRIVYASLYGAGCKKLMDILDVTYEQALSVIASFNRTFPALKNFSRSVVSRCEQNGGRLWTLCGRARRFKNICSNDFTLKSQAERQAVNFIVQGSAADLCKKAMVLTSEQLRRHSPPVEGHLLLQIHDELVWEIRDQHLDTAAVIIKRVMEGCGHQCGMALSLPVALSVGNNWGEMTEYFPNGASSPDILTDQ